MLLNFLLFVIVASAILFPFVAVLTFLGFLDKLTAKPKASPHVYTPEEMAERRAKFEVDFAKMEKSRLASYHH